MFDDFAEYYRTAVLPARKRKPKDKAYVENAVKLIYQRVFAPLRDQVFYSLEELNQAVKERLEEHNNKKLTKMTVSRRELFEEIEKAELKALPVAPYPLKHIQDNAIVQFNYHVELKENHYYHLVFKEGSEQATKIRRRRMNRTGRDHFFTGALKFFFRYHQNNSPFDWIFQEKFRTLVDRNIFRMSSRFFRCFTSPIDP
ncbi:MAG: hypothetical protein SVR04_13275 [Spirochaetota bacterium]|nr:hypothetical protein [Spirochaetota bacterium]